MLLDVELYATVVACACRYNFGSCEDSRKFDYLFDHRLPVSGKASLEIDREK